MRKVSWDTVQEAEGFDSPVPGAYIAVIRNVEDREDKEYLRVEWDFAEGRYEGANRGTFDRAGFWPTVLIRSYKEKALGFFKAFKTALEASNPGYTFREERLDDMIGKRFGVVLGEEEYMGNDGKRKNRLYVAQTRSISAIQKGDFEIPAPKLLPPASTAAPTWPAPPADDGDLPF